MIKFMIKFKDHWGNVCIGRGKDPNTQKFKKNAIY